MSSMTLPLMCLLEHILKELWWVASASWPRHQKLLQNNVILSRQ